MANVTTAFNAISNNFFLCSIVFKSIAMIVGVLGNVTVIIHTIFVNKEETVTSYLVGNLALADLLVCFAFYPIWIIEFIKIILNMDSDQELFCMISRCTIWSFIYASVATILIITVDRYLYFVKPLKYPLIVTRRRVFLAVTGIWLTACCLFIVLYYHIRPFGNGFRSFCYFPDSVAYFMDFFISYIPLILIFAFNFQILTVVRKHRRRIFAETKMATMNDSNEESATRTSSVVAFLVALKAAKTFAIVVVVLTVCILIPAVVGQILKRYGSHSWLRFWYVFLNYEFYGINSIVNVFIYGMRHVKYRKSFIRILSKLICYRKFNN